MAEQDSTKGGQIEAQTAGVGEPDGAPPQAGAILEPDLQAHIGRQLRTVYDEVVNEAVPDRFLRLLEELERKQAKQS